MNRRLLLSLALLLLSHFSQAQEYYGYYRGNKIMYGISKRKVLISLKSSQSRKNIKLSELGLDSLVRFMGDSLFLGFSSNFNTANGIESLRSNMINNDDIVVLSPDGEKEKVRIVLE